MTRSNLLCLLLGASFVVTACNDKSEESAKTPLDLKGFQIIREPGTSQEKTLSTQDFENNLVLTTLDLIGAQDYPAQTLLVSDVKCKNLTEVAAIASTDEASITVYARKTSVPFNGPIEIYKLLPEETLFRPFDQSADSLDCTIGLYAINNEGSRYILSTPISAVVLDKAGFDKATLRSNGVEMTAAPAQLPTIQRDQLSLYSLQTWDRTTFDSYKMMCEAFTLEETFAENDFLDLKRMEFRKAVAHKQETVGRHSIGSVHNQVCRLFIFNDQLIVGYTPYFNFIQPVVPPYIHKQAFIATSFLGIDTGFSMVYHDQLSVVATTIENQNLEPMTLELIVDTPSVRMQLVGNTVRFWEKNHKGPENSWIYDFYSALKVVDGSATLQKISKERYLVALQPGETMTLGYTIAIPKTCVISGGNDPLGGSNMIRGGGVYGAIFETWSPRVNVIQATDPNDFNLLPTQYSAVWKSDAQPLASQYVVATPIHNNYPKQYSGFLGDAVADYCQIGSTVIDQR
jgi:hypothetical protein